MNLIPIASRGLGSSREMTFHLIFTLRILCRELSRDRHCAECAYQRNCRCVQH